MELKKLLCVLLSVAMITSLAACGSSSGGPAEATTEKKAEVKELLPEEKEFSQDDISVTWEDSKVYTEETLDQHETITTYGVKGYEDVPFIKVSDYMKLLFEDKAKINIKDGVLKIAVNDTEAVINPEEDTIYFENPSRFRSKGDVDGAIITEEEFKTVTPSEKNKSTQTKASPLTISLKDYHMPVISAGDDILMPFMALQNTFGGLTWGNVLAYNGKDYYNMTPHMEDEKEVEDPDGKLKDYKKASVSGPFSKKTKTTKAYAEYNYYTACLLLDLTYGHKKEKKITTFDEYFTRINAKNTLTSTNPNTAFTAEFLLFNYLFDSGHDSVVSVSTVFGEMNDFDGKEADEIVKDIKSTNEGEELFKDDKKTKEELDKESEDLANTILGALLEKGFKIPEVAPLMLWSFYLGAIKPENYGTQRLDYSGDTAVIYFESFEDDPKRDPDYYKSPIKKEDEEKSSFAFFYDCFKDIKKHKKIKNVVINLSNNGGGAAAGLVNILGFLSEDGEVKITNLDMPSNSYREEWYHVDTNLDGTANDKDGYGGQYDFFIMTSGSSYSCGTALPYFAQKGKLAKVMGAKPGGGDCVVGVFVDGFGYCAAYSGFLKLGTQGKKGFVSDEKTTKLDYDMMPTILDIADVPWFDADGIADAVHQYKNGSKEYVNKKSGSDDDLSNLFEDLFKDAE